MPEADVLVVDDEACSRLYLRMTLEDEFSTVRSASGGVEALLAMERRLPGLVVTDLRMPEMDGLELLARVRERWPEVPVVLVTVEQDIATVVEAVRLGAVNYLVKPVSSAALRAAARRALATARRVPHGARLDAPEILGESPPMVAVRGQLALAARTDVNILISGETGTGKELVARALHRLSSVASGPFVAHSCALTPADLFESRFFGHRRGAFTGADRDQRGLLEEADDGILFLDELECLAPPHQAQLLRVLDDGEVRPVGSSEARPVSVRFLAATNRHPGRMVENSELREDLYYRLRGFEIDLPPLRERREDIPLLAGHFSEGTDAALTPEAIEVLQAFRWPGNVRQLRNAVRRAAARARPGAIFPRHLAGEGDLAPDPEARQPLPDSPRTLRELERDAILVALERYRGNRSRAARALGIDRSTLRRKLKELSAGTGPPASSSP